MSDDSSPTQSRRAALRTALGNAGRSISERTLGALSGGEAADRSLRTRLARVGDTALAQFRRVLRIVDQRLADSDIRIELAGHQVHLTGDPDGIAAINARLADAVDNETLHVEYHRGDGLHLSLEDETTQ